MSGNHLPDIRDLTRQDLVDFFNNHNEKGFRGEQVYDWIWKKACTSFQEMTNLSKSSRQLMADNFTFQTARPETEMKSKDGTTKVGFRLHDGKMVEGVLIPGDGRFTACISSQVGCALACKFCATGKLGFTRNLECGEIFDQVGYLSKLASERQPSVSESSLRSLSNIVFMGMGEPYLNYENVIKSIEKITNEDGLGMSPQRISVSSVGIPKMIRQMADDNPRYHFALSLHAATDQKRNQIIPFNLNHPLDTIIDALKYYHARTKKRFTIEYILFGNFNDSLSDAKDLALFCKNFPVKINIIEYNPVDETGFIQSGKEKVIAFVDFLEKRNLVVNIRKSRGKDIAAACGQLAARQNENSA